MADTSLLWISACVWFIYFTRVYMRGLMPCVFFASAQVTHTHVTRMYHLSCG